MKYRIQHRTRYCYNEAVTQCINLAYVLPRQTERQLCERSEVTISPRPKSSTERQDYFGNRSLHFSVERAHSVLEVTAKSWVSLSGWRELPSLDFGDTLDTARQRLLISQQPEELIAIEYVLPSPLVPLVPELRNYAESSFNSSRTLLGAVRDLTERIYRDFDYSPGFTEVSTPLSEVLTHRRGVCQDFAHLAIGCIRSMGFPARYLSGYLETTPPPGQAKMVGADVSHAWFSVYVPGDQWYEFDPTNNVLAKDQHIVTGWGRDYSDVSPLRGVIYGGGTNPTLEVSVDVTRV